MKKRIDMKKLFYILPLLSVMFITSCEVELPNMMGDVYGIVSDSETGEPIRGAEVVLSPGNKATVTGYDGHFEFKGLEPIQYKLQVSANGYTTNSRQITVIAGQSVTGDITMRRVAEVEGISLSEDNFNFGSTHTEQILIIKNSGNKGSVSWEITGIDVAWLKASPQSGSIAQGKEVAVKLTVDRNRLTTDEASTTFMVGAAGGSQSVRVNINKPSVTGVKGIVRDASDNHLIENCLVTISPINDTETTGEDGSFKFSGLSAGEYTLRFEKVGYPNKTMSVSVSTGEMKSIDVLLTPSAPFSSSEMVLDYGDAEVEKKFALINNTDTETSFTISDIPSWLTLSHTAGRLQTTASLTITAEIDRDQVSNGSHSHQICIAYTGRTQGEIYVEFKFIKSSTSSNCDVWDGKKATSFAGGSGARYDPYIIRTGGQLLLMNDYGDEYFKIDGDIDLNNKNWKPIEEFSGVLDGNGHTIYNLRVERDNVEYRGLIGNLSGGTVKNLTLRGVTINGSNAGAVAGHMTKTATISNCSVVLTEGSVLRGSYVGGVVGSLSKYLTSDINTVEYCTVESLDKNVSINGNHVGGIVGHMSGDANYHTGVVTNCSVDCDIVGEDCVGGIVGYARNMLTIENCEYDGHISGANAVGGICGNAYPAVLIIGCKVEADIEGDDKVGGISGEFSSSHVIACYSHGTMRASASANHVGGIIGGATYPSGSATLCYSAMTCSHSNYLPIFSPSHEVDCYSIYDTDDIALQMEEDYSDYADYWNFDNTWTWSGTVDGKRKSVCCPRLAWEE